MLVPGTGAGASGELDTIRAACRSVIEVLRDLDLVVVVGGAAECGPFPGQAWGSLRPYGVPVDVGSGPGGPTSKLKRQALFVGVRDDAPAADCLTLGKSLAGRGERVGMLVMGDGSARRSLKGPGYLDDRAEPFDTAVDEALRQVDPEALSGLDERLARALLITGRAPWQVLSGAAGAADDRPWRGTVAYCGTPYGVTYFVAGWVG